MTSSASPVGRLRFASPLLVGEPSTYEDEPCSIEAMRRFFEALDSAGLEPAPDFEQVLREPAMPSPASQDLGFP